MKKSYDYLLKTSGNKLVGIGILVWKLSYKKSNYHVYSEVNSNLLQNPIVTHPNVVGSNPTHLAKCSIHFSVCTTVPNTLVFKKEKAGQWQLTSYIFFQNTKLSDYLIFILFFTRARKISKW